MHFHGFDERQKKRNVDGIFLRLSGGYVLWICFWVLCTDLYVYWFLSGYAHRICYDDDVKVPIFLAGAGDILYGLAVYALQFLLRGRLGLGTYLSRIILPETFYTIILTLIVYRVFYYINYHLMSPLKKESESIWVLK